MEESRTAVKIAALTSIRSNRVALCTRSDGACRLGVCWPLIPPCS